MKSPLFWFLILFSLISSSLYAQLFEYTVNGKTYSSAEKSSLQITFDSTKIVFTNNTKDTLRLSNVLPLTCSNHYPYITGLGDHPLSRTHLFLPGRKPVNIIVPDNAWELGFNCTPTTFGLSRRDVPSIQKGLRKRFETILYPNGGTVKYNLHFEKYTGEWQNALRIAFQQRKLYDKSSFDESLYQREDLKWIRSAFVMHLMMAWDKDFYDATTKKFRLVDFARRGKDLYGGDDVICLWPTWPTLGIDPRNQFDMYRDLPGGLRGLKSIADSLHAMNIKFFIAYNPWDESTRKEEHLKGLATLIRETDADGVVLDTKGESSKELQAAADAVKPGVIMYSEGMAVPKDQEGIVSGRVHNALYYPPMLNLNKLINPPFAIFRVAEVNKERIQREYATSFFNGYGTEINQFAPGHPSWENEQYEYLKKTTKILRENSDVFTNGKLTPLIDTKHDSIWVNKWEGRDKTLYTVFSLKPEGFDGKLFDVKPKEGYHFVDLWNHKEIEPGHVSTTAFNRQYLGTNNEGEVACIAEFSKLIKYELKGWMLSTNVSKGDVLVINAQGADKGLVMPNPSSPFVNGVWIDIRQAFGPYEGDLIIRLFDKGQLIDEAIVTIEAGVPRLSSKTISTGIDGSKQEMKLVPTGKFDFKTTHGDEFIFYPKDDEVIQVSSFLIDQKLVTNQQFATFIKATSYTPSDTTNFLKHWRGNKQKPNDPVVYISYEDAQAYATWAEKRLPTEREWQYAAQHHSKGIADLSGKVWQLTNDVYQSGSYTYIIMKGGSAFKPTSSWWYVQGGPKQPQYRQFLLRVSPGFERNSTVGFRCVKDVE